MLAMGRHYSPSQVNTWLKCNACWGWRYIRKVVTPPGAALVVGKAVHVPAEEWHKRGLAMGKDWALEAALKSLPVEEAEALAGDAFDRFAIGKDDKYPDGPPVDWTAQEEKQGDAKDRAIRMGRRYVEHVAPSTGKPLACEQKTELQPDGRDWTLTTILDAVTTDGKIVTLRDTKSSGKSPSGAKDGNIVVPSDHRRQLAAYRYAWRARTGANPDRTAIDYVWSGKRDTNSATAPADVGDLDEERLFQILDTMHRSIEAGLFQRNPDSWSCNPKWCGYWQRCWVNGEDV